jgi:diacylglycerol kinase
MLNKAAIRLHIAAIVSVSILGVAMGAAVLMIMAPALRPYLVFIDPAIAIAYSLAVYGLRGVMSELTDEEALRLSAIEAFAALLAMPVAVFISLLTPILLILIDSNNSLLYLIVWLLTALIYALAPDS